MLRTPTLEVILHDTIVFPEGGGQPSDTGLIQTSNERVWKVLQARRHGGHAVHYVQVEDAEVDILPFAVGTKVLVKLGDADWDRRYDHVSIFNLLDFVVVTGSPMQMTMHTSQHLLSAVLEDRLNIQTLSWSLTDTPAPCYVELSRSMTSDEIQSIQTTANRYVFEGRTVHVEVQEMEKPDGPEKLEDHARGFAKAIPADYTGGIMRVVVIDRIDRNPYVLEHTVRDDSTNGTYCAAVVALTGPVYTIFSSSWFLKQRPLPAPTPHLLDSIFLLGHGSSSI